MQSKTEFRKCGEEGVKELLWVKEDLKDRGAWTGLEDWIAGKDIFMGHVKKFDVVISAGGCCGMYPRFYSNYFKEVWAFEPDPLNFFCLDRNCIGEGYHKYNYALGDKNCLVAMNTEKKHNVGAHKIVDGVGNIPMVCLDDFYIQGCDLIHLDVEGYEENVLRGASNIIEKYSPVIILEHVHKRITYMEEIGYKAVAKTLMDTVYVRG